MESIKITKTASEINAAGSNNITIDISRDIPWNNDNTDYPQEILIVDNSSITLGILYIEDDKELTRVTDYPSFFSHSPILGDTIKDLPYRTKYLVIKNLDGGSATGDLDLYLRNYVKG